MKRLFSLFKSRVPDIIKRLDAIRKELNEAQVNIEKLITLEQAEDLFSVPNVRIGYMGVLKAAFDDFGVAMWIKDLKSRFLFANKSCCETILKCSEHEALHMKDDFFETDALAKICMQSDRKAEKEKTTLRFVEHGIYAHDQHVFLDVIKSPIFKNDVVVGTVGSAQEITECIPEEIKKRHLNPSSIEIALDVVLCKDNLIKLLERRSAIRQANEGGD